MALPIPAGGAHTFAVSQVAESGTPPAKAGRDHYIDFLRTGSLLIVVIWHWLFNVVNWRADGPHFGNPIATTFGFWALTWLFQVLPVFFFVGGFSHLVSWESVERKGGGYVQFVGKRLRRLLTPLAISLGVAGAAWLVFSMLFPEVRWVGRAIYLILSPLWFLGIYLVMMLLTPLAVQLHRKGGEMVPAVMAGLVVAVDVARFRYHLRGIEIVNLLLVWALAHQLGFFWRRLVEAPRQVAWSLTMGGFIGLVALTNIGLYPRSMVGVPGEAISNMGPPTLCIVALTLFQVGVVLLVRERLSQWLENPGPQKFMGWAGARAMTIYLWHFPGFAIAYALVSLLGVNVPETPDSAWWIQRPLWAVLPALCTIPLVTFFRRFERRAGTS
jgi:peptidoglycan/LPS O-acetylase OafA/YrhL